MTEAEKNYKNGKFNPEPLMKQYVDVIDNIGNLIEDELDPLKENLLKITDSFPEFISNKVYDAKSLSARISAIIAEMYKLIDDIDLFNETIYWLYYEAGKKDYLSEKETN